MKKLLLTLFFCCITATITCATLTVQNSSEDTVRVWLYDSNDDLIDTWIVNTDEPRTLNSGLREIGSIAWALEKHVPVNALETTAHLTNTSAGGTPYTIRLKIKAVSAGRKFFILKNGSYKYQPGFNKKKDTITGKAARVSAMQDEEIK